MDQNIIFIISSLILNIFVVIYIKNLTKYFNIYDLPDSKRKFHKIRTSLFGGSVILINLLLFLIIYFFTNSYIIFETFLPYLFLGSFLFYFFGLIDDIKDLNSNLKFITEILIITFLVFLDKIILIEKIYFQSLDLTITLGSYSHIFTIISITIFLNALNMYDGINLQCGSYCLIVFLSLLFFSQQNILLICLIISLISFLYLNYKSRLFLGDNGTYLLGFIISYLVIYTAKSGNYYELSADKILILMLFPGLDLIRLFVVRLIKKKHPFSSDRYHIHHILLKKVGFKKTIYFLVSLPLLANFLMYSFSNHLILIIVIFTIIYILSLYAYEK